MRNTPLSPPDLTPHERATLLDVVCDSKSSVGRKMRARILLHAFALHGPLTLERLSRAAGASVLVVRQVMRNPRVAISGLTDNPRGRALSKAVQAQPVTFTGSPPYRIKAIRRARKRSLVVRRTHLTTPERKKLNFILKDPTRTAKNKLRARILLHAADLGMPLNARGLAESTGVSYQTIYTVLRDPARSLAQLLTPMPRKRVRGPRIPALLPSERTALKRIVVNPLSGARQVKCARLFLLAADSRQTMTMEELARSAGYTSGGAAKILHNYAEALRKALAPVNQHEAEQGSDSTVKIPIIPAAARIQLEKIVSDPYSSIRHNIRARTLLQSVSLSRPLQVGTLAKVAKVSPQTVRKIMADPAAALRELLPHGKGGAVDRQAATRPRPHIPAEIRTVLNRLVRDPMAGRSRNKRARLLLLAAKSSGPLKQNNLAQAVGVSRQTVFVTLRDPKAAWTKLIEGTRQRRPPVHFKITPGNLAVLKRVAADTDAGARPAIYARVLLLIAGRKEPANTSILSRAAGVSRPTLAAIMKDPAAVLLEVLGSARALSRSRRG